MRIFFIGSIPDHKPGTGQKPKKEHQPLFNAAIELGSAAAERGHTVIVGSESKNTVDYYVVQGMVRFCENNPDQVAKLLVQRPKDSQAPYSDVPSNLKVERKYYHKDISKPHKWVVAHVRMLDSCDALITLGGGTSTEIVGNIAADRLMPVIAIGSFGGSSSKLYDRLQYVYKERLGDTGVLQKLVIRWHASFAPDIIGLAEALVKSAVGPQPHLYFISYSWSDSAVADHVEALLRRNNRNVLRDEDNVQSGGSLSQGIEALINQADTFIALWSKSYANSTWCPNELEYARNKQAKSEKPRRIVLVTLDDTDTPIRFTDYLCRIGQERLQRELAVINMLKEESN
jgi:hypothetical protein